MDIGGRSLFMRRNTDILLTYFVGILSIIECGVIFSSCKMILLLASGLYPYKHTASYNRQVSDMYEAGQGVGVCKDPQMDSNIVTFQLLCN